MTAKPLQYTAYRTRNGKRLVRKWSGEKESFEAIPKKTVSVGAEVASGGRLFQRRLPATGNARSPTVDSHVRRITSCEELTIPNVQLLGVPKQSTHQSVTSGCSAPDPRYWLALRACRFAMSPSPCRSVYTHHQFCRDALARLHQYKL